MFINTGARKIEPVVNIDMGWVIHPVRANDLPVKSTCMTSLVPEI